MQNPVALHWRIYIQNFPAHAPLRDPILSFSHTYSLKSTHVGGPHPPLNGSTPSPPRVNPGSAPALGVRMTDKPDKTAK